MVFTQILRKKFKPNDKNRFLFFGLRPDRQKPTVRKAIDLQLRLKDHLWSLITQNWWSSHFDNLRHLEYAESARCH